MAYQAKNINVIDLKPSTALGVSMPFNYPSVFKSIYTSKDQIKINLINYLLTNKNERVFYPEFGLNLRSKLFEPIVSDTEEDIKQTIVNGIAMNFPNIIINKIKITADADSHLLYVFFSYSIKNTQEADDILLSFAQNG
jgi:phage baseplate assembly protein W